MTSPLNSFFDRYADKADALLGTTTMQVGGSIIPIVWDAVTKSKSGMLGGMDNDTRAVAVAQRKNVPGDPAAMLGKRATVEGKQYRIDEVETGIVNVTFTLISPNSTG